MFQTTGIASIMPDISTKIPEQALQNLVNTEASTYERNTNSIAKIIELTNTGLANINDPEIRKRVEEKLAPMQSEIDDITNTLKTNPREVAYMANRLNTLGLDLSKEFTSGTTGRFIRFSNSWEKGKEAMAAKDPVRANQIFGINNPYYKSSLEKIENGESVVIPSYVEAPNMNDKIKSVLSGVVRDKMGITNFTIGDDGMIHTQEGTTLRYKKSVKEGIREALLADPELKSYYDSQSLFDPEHYSDRHVLRTDKFGKIYYGRGKKGETRKAEEAYSTREHDIDSALNVANMLYLPDVNEIDSKPYIPPGGGSGRGRGRGKEEKEDELMIGSTYTDNPTQKVTTYSSLVSDIASKQKEINYYRSEYQRLSGPNADPNLREAARRNWENSVTEHNNLVSERNHLGTMAVRTAGLSERERAVYNSYVGSGEMKDPRVLVDKLYEARRVYNASRNTGLPGERLRERKAYEAMVRAEDELNTYNRASKRVNDNAATLAARWYPRSESKGTHTYLNSDTIGLSTSKDANEIALKSISAGGSNVVITSGGKPVSYEEFMTAVGSETTPLDKALIAPGTGGRGESAKLKYVSKPLNGKTYTIEVNDNSIRNQFYSQLSNGRFGRNVSLLSQYSSNPESAALLRGLARAKNSFSEDVHSGPTTRIVLPSGAVVDVKKNKNGYISYMAYMRGKDGKLLKAAPTFQSLPETANQEEALIQEVEKVKQNYQNSIK